MISTNTFKQTLRYSHRLQIILFLAAGFLLLSTLLRTALLIKTGIDFSPGATTLLKLFSVGLIMDSITAIYYMLPFALLVLLMPNRLYYHFIGKLFLSGIIFAYLFITLFVGAAEYIFWDEFAARFNFVAVDYLVYTSEVIGNIRESYPTHIIFSVIAATAILLTLLMRRIIFHQYSHRQERIKHRAAIAAGVGGLFILGSCSVDNSFSQISENRYANELANNGIYSFFAAFRNNKLDYKNYYLTRDTTAVRSRLNEMVAEDGKGYTARTLLHRVKANAPVQRRNVILITVESLNADFLKHFGNQQGLTPNLDRLADEGLLFTNIHATGTRTVRGLEAISLSIPPTPGRSIVKRPHNEQMFSINTIFQQHGYENKFIYGGYGYFDNMNYFFANNGFKIIDRTDMDSEQIKFTNAWGVSDEDLFDQVLIEADKSYAQGRPFLNFIMTTSNHRPFTYPAGRIDIPSHNGRKGAVKYTDYAIGRFIRQARQHPWFDNTVFVIVADHCASSAAEEALAVQKYHIPMIFYAPGFIQPQQNNTLASQIDLAPTLLGLLGFEYDSQFFGIDLLHTDKPVNRAFVGNYQKLGYLHGDQLTILLPKQGVAQYQVDIKTGHYTAEITDQHDLTDAITYYQSASDYFEQHSDQTHTKNNLATMGYDTGYNTGYD